MARQAMQVLGLVALLAASAQAQPPGGGRGFGRGFGGMTVSATSLTAMDEVRAEVKADDAQAEQLDALNDELRSRMQSAFQNFQGLENLSEKDRTARMAEARKTGEEIAKEFDAKLAGILNPEQVARLNQLRLQREGANALGRAEVADQLGLSQEQKAKVETILAESRTQTGNRNFRDLPESERQKAAAERQARRAKTESDLLALLTGEQKKAWQEMQGAKFEFPQGRGPGGRRPQ